MRYFLLPLILAAPLLAQNPPVPLAQSALQTQVTIANAASTGTTLNTLTKLTGAPSTAVIAATTDTNGVLGITIGGAGTGGNATIQTSGFVLCIFDGATTAGDYVQISSMTAGNCTDGGSTLPSSGQVLGRVLSTHGGAGTYQIDLTGGSGGGGGGSSSAGGVFCAATMSMGNLTCTPSPAIASYTAGLTVYFTSSASNSGATTINVSALGAKNIFLNGSALSGTHFSSTTAVYSAVYDGTQFNLQPGDLTNGTTATTQSAGDNSTKVQTTAGAMAAANYQGPVNVIGSAGSSQTIACTGGGVQSMTLSAAALTITLTQPSSTTCLIRMVITQAAGGNDTVTITGAKWPAGIAPIMTATANAIDVWSCLLDGTNSYCTVGQNFQ